MLPKVDPLPLLIPSAQNAELKSALATLLFAMQAVSSGRKAPASQTYNVTIKGFKFIPDKLEVNVGDTVIWKNRTSFPTL
jgi:plastocyanin